MLYVNKCIIIYYAQNFNSTERVSSIGGQLFPGSKAAKSSFGLDFCNYANIGSCIFTQLLHGCSCTLFHCVVNMLFTITFAGFYEVEKITGMDIREKQRYFHVKWQGYDDKDNTWEPETNVPKDLVATGEFINSYSGIRRKLCTAELQRLES